MGSCVAYGCTNRFSKKIPGITFHRFPKEEKLKNAWVKAVRRKDWAPTSSSRLCSEHFPDQMIDRTSLACVRLRENAVPLIFKAFPSYLLQSSKMDDSFAPGDAHIVQVGFANNKVPEQDYASENEEEKESGMSDNEKFAEDEEPDLLFEEGLAKEVPETEIVTYLVCDVNQQLSDFTQDYSVALTDKLQLKEASEINNIIQAAPLMSKIVRMESNIEKDEFKKSEMLFKISVLESEIDKFRKQCEKDKRKIKTLLQSQRRSAKKISALKESLAVLKQQKYIVHAKSEILRGASPDLLELLGEQKCQNKDKTVTKRYSLEAYEFAKNLYSISSDAYRYVQNYFDLPTENTISKCIPEKNSELNFNGEDSIVLDSVDDCISIQEDDDDFSESEFDHVNVLENYM